MEEEITTADIIIGVLAGGGVLCLIVILVLVCYITLFKGDHKKDV